MIKAKQIAKNEKKITNLDLFKDLERVIELNKKENPKSKNLVDRDFYREHGKYKDKDYQIFGSFKNFIKAYLDHSDKDLAEFENEKQVLALQEEVCKLKQDRDKLLKNNIKEDKLIEIFQNKIIKLKAPKEIKIHSIKNSNKAESILMLGDFHAGSTIIKEEVNCLNEYNIDIMKERLDRIFYYFIYFCKKFEIKIANITFLGDLWENSIHMETARTNYPNEVEVLFILYEYLTQKLLQLEQYFSEIKCYFVVGNHSRLSLGGGANKPFFKEAAQMNWEYILAKLLKLQFETIFKDKNKYIIEASESLSKVIKVSDRKFLLTHSLTQGGGSSFGSIPYYSVDRNSAKKFGLFYQMDDEEQIFDDILTAHLHSTYKTKTISGNAYGNGSVVGPDPFSLEKLKVASEPEQTMLIVDRGIVIQELTLKCNDPFKK